VSSHCSHSDAIATGARLRWGIVCFGALILAIGWRLEFSDVSVWPLVILVAGGGLGNVVIHGLLREHWYRGWLNRACCLLDITLVALLVVYIGPGGTIAGFFLITLPCAQRGDQVLGYVSLLSATVAYLGAAILHGALSSGTDPGALGFSTRVYVDLAVFLGVGLLVLRMTTARNTQIELLHTQIAKGADGTVDGRATATCGDELWELAHDLNRLLEQVASTKNAVELAAAGASSLAKESLEASTNALAAGRSARATTERLAQNLGDFQSYAEAIRTETSNAAHEALDLHSAAAHNARGATALSELAGECTARVASTVEAATSISTELQKATVRVEELAAISRQIGSAALSNAKIARHTHVLALNAAIEAARAEEHGKEFAVVAERVRTLAADAGRSARDVRDLISEVQSGIAAAAEAIAAGADKAAELDVLAGETSSTLYDLQTSSSGVAKSVAVTADISRPLAEHVEKAAESIAHLSATSERWTAEIHDTVSKMTNQVAALNALETTSQQLSELAVRLGEAAPPQPPPGN